jgi:acyl carrier protein
MGLDTVELVMAFEEEFGVEIPNEVSAGMITVRDVQVFILAEYSKRGVEADPATTFERIRWITSQFANVEPASISLDTTFIGDLGLD